MHSPIQVQFSEEIFKGARKYIDQVGVSDPAISEEFVKEFKNTSQSLLTLSFSMLVVVSPEDTLEKIFYAYEMAVKKGYHTPESSEYGETPSM